MFLDFTFEIETQLSMPSYCHRLKLAFTRVQFESLLLAEVTKKLPDFGGNFPAVSIADSLLEFFARNFPRSDFSS